ncbi:glycoside hydrolase family 32 protein [Actinotalea sp. K2]|uniref:glycoside hydrolase family 32 protein n=1 Tax=Actinotalea sp. K2 TaxID=2939438 RepID=UPI0020179DB0|nr:glycoside hydrolase family 32 protein [Actinotalea sp. K2]MCL3861079.1 glycoside hydrolase family 32 protein [Actinotalea sp. K2]
MDIDVTRPRLHFTAHEGWINDPLGLTFHGGRYHLFFQYVPGQTQWGPDQCWGHATSDDLLHWTEQPVALQPGDGDDGVWSGSIAVPDVGPAALFYTTVNLDDVQVGKARLARPTDETWTSWVKQDVVAELPTGLDVVAYRDPYVFHDGTVWRMLMGAGLADGTATALTYRSTDLERWDYDGLLASRHRTETEPLWMGAVWECPQLFRLGDTWVLTCSVWEPNVPHYEAYAIGDLVDGRFTAQSWGRLSYGPSYYAASVFADHDAHRGLIYWLRDVDDPAGRWASAHSVPHRLSLAGDRVVAEPHPALVAARVGEPVESSGGTLEIGWVSDLEWRLTGPSVQAVLVVTGAESGREELRLTVSDGELTATVAANSWTMPLTDRDVRVLVDGPVVEIFATTGVMALPVPSEGRLRVVTLTGESHLTAHALA